MKALRQSSMLSAFVAGLMISIGAPLYAQCPEGTVHLIVGYSSGGTGDIVVNAVSDALSRRLDQKIVVDYRPGGSGGVAAQIVASAVADGCTLLVGQTAEIAVNPAVIRNLGYNPTKELKAVGLIATAPLALVVGHGAPFGSVGDLVQSARAAKPVLTFASAGRGTPGYFAGELLRLRTHTSLAHIAFDGGGAALNAVLGGQANLYFPALPTAIEEVQKGRLKILAVSSPQRSFAMPDIPTLDEAGLSPFNLDNWVGLFAPGNTSQDIIVRFNQSLNDVLRQPEIKTALFNKGANVIPMTAEEFASFVGAETKRYASLMDTEFCASCPW
jgi:tripartite-type tricarboxylate transporter receptor subunit TctC